MNATNDLQGIEEIQVAIDELKKRAMILDSSSASKKLAPKKTTPAKPKSKNSTATKPAAKPQPKADSKKPAAKKTTAKKTAATKPAAKPQPKADSKKPAAKKTATKKTAATKLAATKLAATKLAATKLAATKLAATKLAATKLAATKLAATKLAATKLAATKLAATKLAATKLAATKLAATKLAAKKLAAKKLAAKKLAAKKTAAKKSEKTPEEEMEASLSAEEIENFRIEKVDMDKLTNKVYIILAEYESNGMLQNELWKKLKLSNRDGSRLSLKLERMGTITREKILQKNRWTYKLILKKTPISTKSIENAPCLVCPVEQRCTLDGEISPRNCQLIEDWVINSMKKPKSR